MLKLTNITKVFDAPKKPILNVGINLGFKKIPFKKTQPAAPKTVLNGISIEIKDGEVYGLIGANGAGKTTLMNIISRMLDATSGTVEIDGVPARTINDLTGKVGYMLDIPAMHEFMNAYEYFEFLAAPLNKTSEEVRELSDNLLNMVGLRDVKTKRIKAFSRGMKQRMGIAAALLSNPKIILMDEPSSALDPEGRYEVIKIIEDLRKLGKTIILSTHILNDVERVCDRVGLLSGGKIVIEGTISEVLSKFSKDAFIVEGSIAERDKVKAALTKTGLSLGTTVENEPAKLRVKFKPEKREKVFAAITSASAGLTGVYLETSTVEEIFLEVSRKEKEAQA